MYPCTVVQEHVCILALLRFFVSNVLSILCVLRVRINNITIPEDWLGLFIMIIVPGL